MKLRIDFLRTRRDVLQHLFQNGVIMVRQDFEQAVPGFLLLLGDNREF